MMASSKMIALIICIALIYAPLQSMSTTCCHLKPAFDACKHYAIHGGQCVPQDCCFAAMNIRNNMINKQHDVVDICHCILDAAHQTPHLNATAFSSIPDGCGMHLPFNFNLGMNCHRMATNNKILLKTAGRRKMGEVELLLLIGKDIERRRILKRRSSFVNTPLNSSTTTPSSSSKMNGPSFYTYLVAIVEALLIAFHNA